MKYIALVLVAVCAILYMRSGNDSRNPASIETAGPAVSGAAPAAPVVAERSNALKRPLDRTNAVLHQIKEDQKQPSF